MTSLCPVDGFWNIEATHYYKTESGIVCHSIIPQYNIHGKYWIGSSITAPYHGTPSSCANDSLPYISYMYHGSIGFYSFFDGIAETFCTKDNTGYTYARALGTFDINGVFLVNDMGGTASRMSFWYAVVGGLWLVYRGLTIRRSYLVCRRYGQKCTEMGVGINQKEAMIFVQESLRLSAHGSRNYHRAALLYLIVDGIMTDLFLIIANDGWTTRIQYLSLGYNLSGLMLLMFEMVESMNWLSDKWRQRVKRVLFSYETTFEGGGGVRECSRVSASDVWLEWFRPETLEANGALCLVLLLELHQPRRHCGDSAWADLRGTRDVCGDLRGANAPHFGGFD